MKEFILLEKLIDKVHVDNENENDEIIQDLTLKHVMKNKLESYYKKFLNSTKEIPEINEQLQAITNQYKQFRSFLMELEKNIEEPVIVIKGFSNYHITNGRILLRGTSDIDILARNPYEFKELLVAQGFMEIKTETTHELSELQKEGILIDLHKFVPVVSYPEDINDISVKNNMSTTSGSILKGKITYCDLLENTVKLSEKILVPNVNIALIILCVSIFRDYITSVDKLPHFKLINLVEVYLLLQEDNFHADDFLQISQKFHAEHCVEFVNILLKEIYQVSLPSTSHTLNRFPQILMWNFNQWIVPKKLFNSVFNISFESALLELGAKELKLKSNNNLSIDCISDINVYYASRDNQKKPINMNLNWDNKLYVHLSIENVEGIHKNDIININFSEDENKMTFFGSKERQKSFGSTINRGRIIYNENKKSLNVEFTLSENELRAHYLIEENKVGMNIYIEKHENKNEINCIIPIIIQKI
ncbi:hypothetical protein J2Z32_001498 [Paenibacillus turicensis]|uniref:Nucleotidyltransferase family protein n=1 Tax=Paenibacillus turicensis TaxID=160487 RepID=A0ABS4FR45_9BACL|nr:nucleotidyltransferase family protein [Paenibacillus turicensis]MBP1904874.1 hypothetical protein [Paenibacillus turicensis]